MWVLIDNKDEKGGEEEETEVRRKRRRKVASWACRSVGYHQNLPCMSGAFSHDGSLLALNFSKVINNHSDISMHLNELCILSYSGPHSLGALPLCAEDQVLFVES